MRILPRSCRSPGVGRETTQVSLQQGGNWGAIQHLGLSKHAQICEDLFSKGMLGFPEPAWLRPAVEVVSMLLCKVFYVCLVCPVPSPSAFEEDGGCTLQIVSSGMTLAKDKTLC